MFKVELIFYYIIRVVTHTHEKLLDKTKIEKLLNLSFQRYFYIFIKKINAFLFYV